MKKVFKDNPKLQKCFCTSDGECFYQENDAKNHAKNLDDKTVDCLENENFLEVIDSEELSDEEKEAAKFDVDQQADADAKEAQEAADAKIAAYAQKAKEAADAKIAADAKKVVDAKAKADAAAAKKAADAVAKKETLKKV